MLCLFLLHAAMPTGTPPLPVSGATPEQKAQISRLLYGSRPGPVALTIFKEADCTSDEIEQLKKGEMIDAEKMANIEKLFHIMLDIIRTAPNEGIITNHEFKVMCGLAQACPDPKLGASLMLSAKLMWLYSNYTKTMESNPV